MVFTVSAIAYFLVYGFTLLTAIIVVYHFNRFGIRRDYPGKFFIGALMFISLVLAVINLQLLGEISELKTLPWQIPVDFNLFKIVPFPSISP